MMGLNIQGLPVHAHNDAYRVRVAFGVYGVGLRVECFSFDVEGSWVQGFRHPYVPTPPKYTGAEQELGLGVGGLGCGVWGLGFGVWGLGFRVWTSGFRA